MPNLAALTSRRSKIVFLGEQDVARIKREDEEIDALYGATLDNLPPQSVPQPSERRRAA
jgi:hypothetical protein